MPPTLARRLGACVNNITKYHHVRLSTKASGEQKAPSNHTAEHLERLAFLQAEDQRLIKPVKAKISDYQAVIKQSREFLMTLPPALQALEVIKSPAYTLDEHRSNVAEALASLDQLGNVRLPEVLAHLEDLELEEYPQPGSNETEIDFINRVASMSAEERQDELDSMNMEIGALHSQAAESMKRLELRHKNKIESEEIPATVLPKVDNPFAPAVVKAPATVDTGKKKADEKPKFGLSTEEQFASVIADAAPRNDAIKKKVAAKPNFGLGQDTEELKVRRVQSTLPVRGKQKGDSFSDSLKSAVSSLLAKGSLPETTESKPEPKPRSPRPSSEASSGSAWGVEESFPESDIEARMPIAKPTSKPAPKPQSYDLNSLQARLEASWKRTP